jgi:membrane-associated phospholipid phosphatase
MPRGTPTGSAVGIATLLLMALLPRSGIAADQPCAPGRTGTCVASLPADLWADAVHLPTPANAWWLLGGTVAALLVHTVEDPESVSRTLNQPVFDELADFGNIWGDVRLQAPLALAIWGIGSSTGSDEAAGLGYDLSRSLLLTYGAVSLLKVGFNRERPNGEDYSFPSGHTASAFSTAGVVSGRYGGWAGGVAVGLGVLAGLGRMEDLKHYTSDVFAGATIGWIIGRNAARSAREDRLGLQLVPFGRGLAVRGSF